MKINDFGTHRLPGTVPTDRKKGTSWLDLEPSEDLFWEPLWDQIGPRGAKMSPRGPSRAPKYRKHTTPKTMKNHWFFQVFGGPRPSKTAYKDPKRLPRGYLGLLEAILSHLGAILETRAFKIAPASCARGGAPPKLPILGPILGLKIGFKIVFLGVVFLTIFWTFFGPLLGPFWGLFWDQIGPRRSQDKPKRAIKSFKVQKSYIFKNLKKPLVFLRLLESRSLPRKP